MGRASVRHLHHVRALHHRLPDGYRHRLHRGQGAAGVRQAAGLGPKDLLAAADNSRDHGSPLGVTPEKLKDRIEWLEDEHEVPIALDKEKAEILLTVSSIEVMKYPDSVVAMAKLLNHAGVDWTLSSKGYEATNFGYLAGKADVAKIMVEPHRRGGGSRGRQDRGHPRMRPCLRRDALVRRQHAGAAAAL